MTASECRAPAADPRYYQALVLGGLLLYGIFGLRFEVGAQAVAVIFASALSTQYLAGRVFRTPRIDLRSAFISSLSLCLLARADNLWLLALAAALAMASKFILRWRGKHIFNPVNFALGLLMLTGTGWVSPGQWGNAAFFGFLLACLGGIVLYRALRSDVTLAFLAFYAGILFGRALWLGDPLTIPWHQLQNGAFLLFSFFMISDPKTTPDSRAGRIIFAALVAAVAGYIQFVLYRPLGLIWALFLCAPLLPVLDWLLPGPRYRWPGENADKPVACR